MAGFALPLALDGFSHADLHRPDGLRRLHEAFLQGLRRDDASLAARLEAARATPEERSPARSALLLEVAAHTSAFLGKLFGIEAELAGLQRELTADAAIFRVKQELYARGAFRRGAPDRPTAADYPALQAQATTLLEALAKGSTTAADPERGEALAILPLLEARKLFDRRPAPTAGEIPAQVHATVARVRDSGLFEVTGEGLEADGALVRAAIARLDRFVFARALHPDGKARIVGWSSYHLQQKLDFSRLVQLRSSGGATPWRLEAHEHELRRRDGFGLTDDRGTRRQALSETDTCMLCHERSRDSCSTGLAEKEGGYKVGPTGAKLHGCPLEEHISEMHARFGAGDPLGALALVCVGNPMLPGTGHRICNDCMKSCIFQTQDPVDIPRAETRVLTEVLALPWGFELWSLLTRFNPVNLARPFALPHNGRNVLVAGQGPAGYTLAHHLCNEGFGVVGIDGLKIEPLPEALLQAPIRDAGVLRAALDERILGGFGGVSEYGITVRWDKSFLSLLQLNLERRQNFRLFGGVRLGGTVTVEQAFELGFDHVALAAGAGRPTLVSLKNNLLRGIRKASDFLMSLQLSGAFKRDSLSVLQVRLPAIVIGGGLTAIDAATELVAWYPVQVEKLLARWETLVAEQGAVLEKLFDPEEREVLQEQLAHGRAVRAERARAAAAGEAPDFVGLVRGWGGVTLCYRKAMTDSPAYRLNHEEIQKGLEEGIWFAEGLDPKEALPDAHGAVRAVTFARGAEAIELPARTVLIAAGTSPNTMVEKEAPGHFALDERGQFFRSHAASVAADGSISLTPAKVYADLQGPAGFFTSYLTPDRRRCVSFYGDNHPQYAGSVVKAMASGRDGAPAVTALFARELAGLTPEGQPAREAAWARFTAALAALLEAEVVKVERLTPTIVDVTIRAPAAARRFQPGQFYRLQTFEGSAPVVDGTRLTTEGLALTGAWVDEAAGLLSLIVLEMGASSRLVAALRPGQRVVCMGPTGAPTEIPKGETVLLAGGGLGNAVLFSIGRALKANGCRVLYFAGYRNPEDVFKQDEIEAGTDQVIWAVDRGQPIAPRRAGDLSFVGNMVEAILAYGRGALGPAKVPLAEVDRVIAIGSDRMMAAVKEARRGVLAPLLKPAHEAIGSINSPMQCMMKEICAQCLQRQVGPDGKERMVFTCMNQDQRLDEVDFAFLAQRLKQGSVGEKVANLWLQRCLSRAELPRV